MESGERQQKRRFVILTAIFSGSIGVLVLYPFLAPDHQGRGVYPEGARRVRARDADHGAARGDLRHACATIRWSSTWIPFPWTSSRARLPRRSCPASSRGWPHALAIPVADIEQKVPPKSYRQFQPIEVKGGVIPADHFGHRRAVEDFHGVSWHNKPIRSYVESGTLAHVIGYVGDITREELQVLYNKNYAAGTRHSGNPASRSSTTTSCAARTASASALST